MGDVIKIVAWIFGNYMWAKGHTLAFIGSELGLSWLYGGGCLLIWGRWVRGNVWDDLHGCCHRISLVDGG